MDTEAPEMDVEAPAAVAEEAPGLFDDLEDAELTPWYEPGLLRRIGRRRRRERARRVTLRERLRARGLHWSSELVVGVLVAVLVTSLATVALFRLSTGGTQALQVHGDGGAAGSGTTAAQSQPTPTAPCLAAPIPGAPLRPCTH